MGPPSDPNMTVDHVNLIVEDNNVNNLRSATTRTQLENKYYTKRLLEMEGQEYNHLTDVSRQIDVPLHKIRDVMRYTKEGEVISIGSKNVTVKVKTSSTKKMKVQETISYTKPVNGARLRNPPRHEMVFKQSMSNSVSKIEDAVKIKRTSILTYIGQAVRECSSQLQLFLTRTGLNTIEMLTNFTDLDKMIDNFKHLALSSDEFSVYYKCFVLKHFPDIKDDWEVIRASLSGKTFEGFTLNIDYHLND